MSVAVHDFEDVNDEATLREIHDYVFKRYNLLDRVIRARKLHHSHFFAIDNDYGHEKYLDKLQNERHVMTKALEKLGKRAAALMHSGSNGMTGSRKHKRRKRSTARARARRSSSSHFCSDDIRRRLRATSGT